MFGMAGGGELYFGEILMYEDLSRLLYLGGLLAYSLGLLYFGEFLGITSWMELF